MSEKMDANQPDPTVAENSPSNVVSSNQSHQSEKNDGKLDEVLEKLKSLETQFGDHQRSIEKLQSIQDQLEDLKPQKTSIEEPNPEVTEEKNSAEEKQKTPDPLVSKQFVLKHVFKNMSGAEEDKPIWTESEEHFGVKWCIGILRENENLDCYLHCQRSETENKWSIETEFEINVKNGSNNSVHSEKLTYCYFQKSGYGFPSFLKWDDMEKNYLVDDSLKIEIHIKIIETTGIYKDTLRTFDDSMQDVSDIVLIVNNKKFYVLKLYLATHSAYFKAMFLGMFGDSRKSEITLTGIDTDDFHKYLEVVYAESAIDETTVEGILLVADMYDTPLVIRKCEEFLIEKSKKKLKKRLLMSIRYRLESLKKKCLDEIKTISALRLATSGDIDDWDPSLMAILFKKSLSFQ